MHISVHMSPAKRCKHAGGAGNRGIRIRLGQILPKRYKDTYTYTFFDGSRDVDKVTSHSYTVVTDESEQI